MKLVNFPEEDAPTEFYIFERGGALTNHQFTIGVLNSASFSDLTMKADNPEYVRKYMQGLLNHLPFQMLNADELDVGTISPWMHKLHNRIRLEWDCEYTRTQINRLLPCRLSAVYAFGSEEDCIRASRRGDGWNINSVKKFRVQSPPELTRIAKANMLIYDLAIEAYKRGAISAADSVEMWRSYWSCSECDMDLPSYTDLRIRETRNSGLMTEYLIEGSLTLVR